MRYLGIDLAWGEQARTGMAELDHEGRLARAASVRTDAEIAAFLGELTPGVVAAIDAPLIVANETGQRDCERQVGRLFSRFHAGAYPANRGNPAFNPEPRGARLASRFGWALDPATRPGPDGSVAIEVYPHPAMVSVFGLSRVIPYKNSKGRDTSSRQFAFQELFDCIEVTCGSLLRLESSARWQHLRDEVEGNPRHVDLDTVEDEVDAIFCAYLAWLWTHHASHMLVLGDLASGYIVTPPPPDHADGREVARQEPRTGALAFGDGLHGQRPASDDKVAGTYASGGGAAGEVAATSVPLVRRPLPDGRASVAPTGRCFCGCGQATKPKRFFVANHDRKAETRVIRQKYGSIPAFVVAHGYGPDHPDGGNQD